MNDQTESAGQGIWADAEGERALRQYRTLVNTVDDGIYQLDAEGRFVAVNDVIVEMTGYSREEFLGEHVSLLLDDDDIERIAGEIRRRLAAEDPDKDSLEFTVRTADGETIVWELRLNLLVEDGEFRGTVGTIRDITDRKRMEQRLRVRERQLQHQTDELAAELDEIYGRITDGFYALDDQWRFTHVNERAEELIDVTGEGLVGETVWDVFEWAADSKLREEYERTMDTQETTHFEVYYPDPLDAWYEIHAYPSETGLSVYFRDVTDSKERERELERYETIVETVNDGIYVVDEDGRFTMVNDAYCELTGYAREDLLGAHVSLIVDDETIDRAKEMEKDMRANRLDKAVLKADLQAADGERVPLEATFALLPGDDLERIGVVRDITERIEREHELEHRTRQQRVVAEIGQFALEVDDPDELMHEAANRVAEVLDNEYCKVLDLDLDAEELLLRQGVGWHDGIVGEATVSAVEDDSQAAYTLANDHPIVVEDLETETRFSGPDLLRNHDVKSGVSTVIGPFDEPWGILGTHDTERREYSEEDVTFVQSIANILAEAIERHQYQQELEQLIDDLEESNERLEQFAYAASHDLQEPLRMISSYLRLIEQRYGNELDEDGEEFLEFAVDGADRMREMINGLLKYSRVETRGDPFEPVNLGDVLDKARQDLQLQIGESDAEITDEGLPTIEGDATQLQQVFQNLLGNAIQYSGDEPPRIHVSARCDGSEWVVSVADEGIGIDPDDQDRIFEVFQRLHTQDKHDGTGIGLALCKRIVERHGGEICVDSDRGEGTTISFTLPAVDENNRDQN